MRALVLAGGGSRGSWQAGALRALSEHADYFAGFHFVSGTSVGAINAAAIAMYPRTHIRTAVDYLHRLWTSRLDIWKLRFPAYLSGLWNPSLGTNDGLRRLLTKELDPKRIKESGVQLVVNAVDLVSGELRRFTQDFPDLLKAILASASFPMAFPPEEIDGGYYTDGGVRDIAPLKPAIAAGATEIVVVTTANPYRSLRVRQKRFKTVLDIGERVVGLMADEILFNDLRLCALRNRAPQGTDRRIKLRVIFPKGELHDSLDFDPNIMQQQWNDGYTLAKQQLDLIPASEYTDDNE